jgi:hypothetical protein
VDELDELDQEYFALLDADGGEPIGRRRRPARRAVAAALLVGLMALFVLEPGGIVFRRSPDPPRPADPTPTSAAQLDAGPGGRLLTDADWALETGSAVLLGVQQPSCSGSVTLIGGHRYVTSARHCLQDLLAAGVVSPEAGQAQEVTGLLSGTVRVFDPRTHRVIASLDRIAVGTGDTDLLVATTRDGTNGFRSKPARTVDRAPAVGDEVATWAASGANAFVPRKLAGIYLGTRVVDRGDGHEVVVDLVGYRQTAAMAAIGPGHSGSSPTGAGGRALGPLLFSLSREVRGDERQAEVAAMAEATGIDLDAERLASVDENLHLAPADYDRFDALLRT